MPRNEEISTNPFSENCSKYSDYFWRYLKIFFSVLSIREIIFGGGDIRTYFFTTGKWWFKIKYTKIHSKHVFIRNLKVDSFAFEKCDFITNGWLLRVDLVIVTPAHTCVVSTIFPEKYCVTVRRLSWKPDWIQCQKHYFFGRLRRKRNVKYPRIWRRL